MDKKYYTVAEFAKKVEVSPQYIYKQTKKQLRNYCKLVEGHKVISESAFSLFAVKNNETTSENEPVVVEYLLQQLKEKDGQIALLSEEVRRRSEEILELTKAFRETILNITHHIFTLNMVISQLQYLFWILLY